VTPGEMWNPSAKARSGRRRHTIERLAKTASKKAAYRRAEFTIAEPYAAATAEQSISA
jgi:hypothetical protein